MDILMAGYTEFLFRIWKLINLLFVDQVTAITGRFFVLSSEWKSSCVVVEATFVFPIDIPSLGNVTLGTFFLKKLRRKCFQMWIFMAIFAGF
jgi:hypothetical protein